MENLKITVCIKQVPGTTEVKIDPETGVLIRDGIDAKMNPYDLPAIETAVRIKEMFKGSFVRVISMGPPAAAAVIREAFMMGADEGILMSDRRFAGADVLATAYTLSQGIRSLGKSDLIICGKMTTDGDTAQVGPEIAEFLDIPHVTNVIAFRGISDGRLFLETDSHHNREEISVEMPCLISVEKAIFQPRLPSYRLKVATASREIRMITMDGLSDRDEKNYGLNGSPTRVLKIFPPVSDVHQEIWKGSGEELSDKIMNRLNQMKILDQGV